MENEAGEVVQQQSWPLGEIKNWETIEINYSIEFDSSMATGTYKNSAQLVGFHESVKEKYQTPYESPIATHNLGLGITPAGQVLGIANGVCEPYITEYLRFGKTNTESEVSKLQVFLNNHLGLNMPVSGFFNQATEQGVRDFQQKYRSEVLTPWGLNQDSGYVYYTTQKKINEIVCEGRSVFPLAPSQLNEIGQFKSKVQEMSRFSFRSEAPAPPVEPPRVIEAVVPPTPSVKQTTKSPPATAINSIIKPAVSDQTNSPEPTGAWKNVKVWLNSFSLGLRSVIH
jgi:hypothetical protein